MDNSDNIKEAYETCLSLTKENPSQNSFGGFEEIFDEMRKNKIDENYAPHGEKLTEEEIDSLMAAVSPSEISGISKTN